MAVRYCFVNHKQKLFNQFLYAQNERLLSSENRVQNTINALINCSYWSEIMKGKTLHEYHLHETH